MINIRNISIIKKWFPPFVAPYSSVDQLNRFYAENTAYHAMTASGDKTIHPQVKLLSSLIYNNKRYAEIGCGGGAVTNTVSTRAHVTGFDISQIALAKAKDISSSNAEYVCADCSNIPARNDCFDGVYSFEVLEHIWEPDLVVREMLRITKPSGFILLSVPLVHSLDLHLKKSKIARLLEFALAILRYLYDKYTGLPYVNIEPDLDGEVYPDCDLVTAIIPANFVRSIEDMGCKIVFWDTTYMCAHNEKTKTDLKFQKNTANWFSRNYGDHLLILAKKNQ